MSAAVSKLRARARTTAQSKPAAISSKSPAAWRGEAPVMVLASGVTAKSSVPAVESTHRRKVAAPANPARGKRHKPRLLWIGDALVPTGFATVTHSVLHHLRNDWEVTVSGVNYDGSAHELPYDVMPACQGGDMWGMNRFQHLCAEFDPAAVIINNDWWNVAQFARLAPAGLKMIGYMPVDGGNLDPADMADLNKLHAAVWYTGFGYREACAAGFAGRRHVIPHGIETSKFEPGDRNAARRSLGLKLPADAYIVGNVNRNQPRKRLDLTIQIFAAWIKQHRIGNAHLLLHCAQKDTGWDLRRVAACYGVEDRLILTGPEDIRAMEDAGKLKSIYQALDIQMTTTLGEGWGLTTMEGMACGIPQIVPDSSALGEWAVTAVKVPCSRTLIHPEINTQGALVDEAPFVSALHGLYQSKAARGLLAAQGLEHVRGAAFRWENVARQFQALLAAPARASRRKTMECR
ncbi:glycosyltransferase family 4 protein [Prosthecobacter sp.]|uniref:glycosyltransferase family 4 protein n=1 Tax=Prosthecobacter sp. TaxID=1965333 RepID=UPI0037843CF3